jgi:thermitase
VPETSQTTTYYYADGARVPLAQSTHFTAVRATTEEAEALAERSARASADPQRPVQMFRVPDQDLVVFKVDGAAGGTSVPMAARPAGERPGPEVYEPMAEGDSAGAAAPTALIDNGELIVKFAPGTEEEGELLVNRHLETVREDYPEPGAKLLRTVREQDSAVAIANDLHELTDVEYAVPNFVRLSPRLSTTLESLDGLEGLNLLTGAGPTFTPDDPLLSLQWGVTKIRCPEAWDISRGSSAISVAIIDEGGNAHEDYVQVQGFDARFNDSDPSPNPTDGHGVACAGIVAATANNGRGIAGVAPNSTVRHIRIAHGVGDFWSTTDAVIADGIRRAVDLGADVLSNSWAGGGASTVVTNAFIYAQTHGRGGRGTPIAAATGNEDVLGVSYPARLSPTIRGFLAVGASNQWDQRKSRTSSDGETWWGSNYGPEVDVVAPGVKIPTTDIMGGGGYGAGNYVNTFNGTSSATPHVAGLMALILGVDPELRSWEVEDIIKLTARDLGTAGRDQHHGFGRIDARAALEAATRLWCSAEVTPMFLGSGQESFIRVSVRMFNPGINTVRLNGLTFRSHADNGTVLDEFVYQGNPGPVMVARSGNDARFTNLLFRANGTRASWSCRWSVNWGYTFWRPNAPIMQLGATEPGMTDFALDETLGRTETGRTLEGRNSGGENTPDPRSNGHAGGAAPVDPAKGDRITVDRANRAITITVR